MPISANRAAPTAANDPSPFANSSYSRFASSRLPPRMTFSANIQRSRSFASPAFAASPSASANAPASMSDCARSACFAGLSGSSYIALRRSPSFFASDTKPQSSVAVVTTSTPSA